MKKLCFSVTIVFLLFGCKSQQSNSQSAALTVEKATWTNWTGGQPGVGGTTYLILIQLPPKVTAASASELVLDGKPLKVESSEVEDGLLTLRVIENRSNVDETIPMNKRRPDFRTSSPETSSIKLVLDGREEEVAITTFVEEEGN